MHEFVLVKKEAELLLSTEVLETRPGRYYLTPVFTNETHLHSRELNYDKAQTVGNCSLQVST